MSAYTVKKELPKKPTEEQYETIKDQSILSSTTQLTLTQKEALLFPLVKYSNIFAFPEPLYRTFFEDSSQY